MVAALYLVERTSTEVFDDRNRVRQVVVHEDDAQADSAIIAAVISTLNGVTPVGDDITADGNDVYPAGYFDTVTQIGATPAGPLATDGDLYAFPSSVASVTT